MYNNQDILVRTVLNKPPLSLYSTTGADPTYALLYHLNVQQSHMLPYSTLYVAIVTLQCFSGVYIQQDVWWKCVPCSKSTFIQRFSLTVLQMPVCLLPQQRWMTTNTQEANMSICVREWKSVNVRHDGSAAVKSANQPKHNSRKSCFLYIQFCSHTDIWGIWDRGLFGF